MAKVTALTMNSRTTALMKRRMMYVSTVVGRHAVAAGPCWSDRRRACAFTYLSVDAVVRRRGPTYCLTPTPRSRTWL